MQQRVAAYAAGDAHPVRPGPAAPSAGSGLLDVLLKHVARDGESVVVAVPADESVHTPDLAACRLRHDLEVLPLGVGQIVSETLALAEQVAQTCLGVSTHSRSSNRAEHIALIKEKWPTQRATRALQNVRRCPWCSFFSFLSVVHWKT